MPPADNPLSRIVGAGAEGFRTGPRIVDLPAIEQAERSGPVGYYINSPLVQGVNFPLRALNAAYKGGQAAIDVGLSPLNPLLGTNFSRDIAALPEAFPFGAEFLRPARRPPIPAGAPTCPRFVSELYGAALVHARHDRPGMQIVSCSQSVTMSGEQSACNAQLSAVCRSNKAIHV